jgi:hypothetical protein
VTDSWRQQYHDLFPLAELLFVHNPLPSGTCWATACKTISQPGPKLVASPSNRQAVRTQIVCPTTPCLQWARILQVYFRPCRTRVRAFLGRLRAKYVTKGFLMLKPGLACLPARVHTSKQRFLAGSLQ